MIVALVGIAAVLFWPMAVAAQALPDAGSVLQQVEEQRRESLPSQPPPALAAPPPLLEERGGATIVVDQFRFAGNTLLGTEELAASVSSFVGRPIDFAGLQNAAIAVATAYREAGWVVRSYLPQQDITRGIVTIQIVEATFGTARFEGDTGVMSSNRLRAMVENAQQRGRPVNAAHLDRALLIINDLPGVTAAGRLAAGVYDTETDLIVAMDGESPINGGLTLDDAGSRFTGETRVIGTAQLNNRLGVGDRADALLLHSRGSDYVNIGYSLPVGSRGWRVGASASHLDYEIVMDEFAALDAHGTSTNVGIDARYPLRRSRLSNLYLDLDADNRRFDNKSAGTTTTDYSVHTAGVRLHGNRFDSFMRGGLFTAGIGLVQGRVDLSGSPNRAADAATTRTDGSFSKLNLTFSRLQSVTERISLFAGVEVQSAGQNLDSSQKLYLGGSQGVRAYPESEAGGSEGVLANLEMRTRVMPNLDVTAFVDWGDVRVNKHNDFAGAPTVNDIELKGFGASIGWTAKMGLSVKATLARRSGENPNPTLEGFDQDGSLVKNRVWLQLGMPF